MSPQSPSEERSHIFFLEPDLAELGEIFSCIKKNPVICSHLFHWHSCATKGQRHQQFKIKYGI
jgi:hypothetical protein